MSKELEQQQESELKHAPPVSDEAVVSVAESLGISKSILQQLMENHRAVEPEPELGKQKERRCFVISPIGAEDSEARIHADDVLKFIIEPAMDAFGIKAIRSDHMTEAGRITEQMFREIFQADICIAVLTNFNPNVFYELAVAQCAARPVIILIEKGQELPFDVKDLRSVHYSMNPVSELVDGVYADQVKDQLEYIRNSGWSVAGLFEQFPFGPKFQHEQQIRRIIEASRPEPLSTGSQISYAIPEHADRELVVVTGDIVDMHQIGADAIVSPIDTHLELARYHDASISGTLRYLDAEKSKGGRILRDSLVESITEQIKLADMIPPVRPGTVIATPTNRLQERLGIKQVFHVAATEGNLGRGYKMRNEILDFCVRNVFLHFNEQASNYNLKTIAFPMLGAAATRLEVMSVARHLITAIISELKQDNCACSKVFIIAWLESHRHAISQIANELELETLHS